MTPVFRKKCLPGFGKLIQAHPAPKSMRRNFNDSKPSAKIAAFDLDGTLVKTKSGAEFALNGGDWMFAHRSVPAKLKEMYAEGFRIVIFSNQVASQTRLTAGH